MVRAASPPPGSKQAEAFGDEPIRVLHLLHNLKREGAQSVVSNLALASRRTGVIPLVLGWKETGPLAGLLRENGVHVAEPLTGPTWRAPVHLRGLIDDLRIDILHAHMSDSAVLGAASARSLNVPLVITHHSNRLLPKMGPFAYLLRRAGLEYAVRAASANVAVTPAVRDQIRRTFRLPLQRTCCIPNGVAEPPSACVNAAQAERRLRARKRLSRPRIVAVGRLVELKRHVSIIGAMQRLVAKFPDARLSILGDGPLRSELLHEIETLGLGSHVNLAGAVANVGDFLAAADVFVSASRYEGLPIAVLEAMSWGLPVIVTNVAGHRDIVRSGENGIVVPFNDVATLGECMIRLIRDPNLRLALGERARADAAQFYTSSMMACAYAELYRSTLATSRTNTSRRAAKER